nr:putative late gene regulator [Raoultella sp. NCTC 9187]
MNLENTVKYHFAKSTLISDSPRATASDSLTGTDIMAAMGMTQERAAMGYSAFLGKMGISNNDRERAIELLAEYALTRCDKVAALRKLAPNVKPRVIHILAAYALRIIPAVLPAKKNVTAATGLDSSTQRCSPTK